MTRLQIDAVIQSLRNIYRKRNTSLQALRRALDAAAAVTPLPPGVTRTRFAIDDLPAAWLTPSTTNPRDVLLYLHGGGFVLGSIKSHSNLAARLAEASGTRALLIAYRLAPEHPFPAALEDVTRTWRWLLETGQPPERTVLAGDSAGGGLALSAMVSWRDHGLPLPGCAVLLSPWVDLTCSAPSLALYGPEEPLITQAWCTAAADLYAAGADKRSPLLSPLWAPLQGLPPLLIQAGGRDALLDDARRLEQRAVEAGVVTNLEVWEEMPHAFHLFGPVLDEAEEAVRQAGAFARRSLPGTSQGNTNRGRGHSGFGERETLAGPGGDGLG